MTSILFLCCFLKIKTFAVCQIKNFGNKNCNKIKADTGTQRYGTFFSFTTAGNITIAGFLVFAPVNECISYLSL
jgi:hypothetical protein